MAACEECWSEAYWRSRLRGGHQADHYRDALGLRPNKGVS